MIESYKDEHDLISQIRETIGSARDPLLGPSANFTGSKRAAVEVLDSRASRVYQEDSPRDPWSAGLTTEVYEWRYQVRTPYRVRMGAVYVFQTVWAGGDDVHPTQYVSFSEKRPMTEEEVEAVAQLIAIGALPEQVATRLDSQGAADWAGVAPKTWSSYVTRGQAPKADGYTDGRSPYWEVASLRAWRPRK